MADPELQTITDTFTAPLQEAPPPPPLPPQVPAEPVDLNAMFGEPVDLNAEFGDVVDLNAEFGEGGEGDFNVRQALQTFAQGASFGWADEAGAHADAMVDGAWFRDDYWKTYDMFKAGRADDIKQFADTNPATALTMEILGGVMAGGGLGGAGIKGVAKIAPKAGQLTKLAAAGIAEGGVAGAGFAEKGETLKGAVTGAALGAGAGIGLGAIAKAVAKPMAKAAKLKKNAKAAEEAGVFMDTAQQRIDELVIEGADPRQAFRTLSQELDISAEDFLVKMQTSGKKLRFSPTEAAVRQESRLLTPNQVATTAVTGKSGGVLDRMLGVVSTRIGNINPQAKTILRKHDFNVHTRTAAANEAIKGLSTYRKLPAALQQSIKVKLLSGKRSEVMKMADRLDPEFGAAIRTAIDEMDKLRVDLKATGRDLGFIKGYWPRVIKDYDGLLGALGQDPKVRTTFNRALAQEAKSLGVKKTELTDAQKSEVFNRLMSGKGRVKGEGLSFGNERKIDELDENLAQFYADPLDSVTSYLHKGIADTEKRRLFSGRAEKLAEDGDDTIGTFVRKLTDDGDLDPKDEDELISLFTSRFTIGEVSPNKLMQGFRDIAYATTLGNPLSAMTQLQDIAMGFKYNGVIPQMKGLFGRKQVDAMKDFGLESIEADLRSSPRATARIVNAALGVTGFKKLDRLGKNSIVNGALHAAQGRSRNPKKMEALRTELGEVFGDEADAVLNDLRNGDITENVKLMLFNKLADVQPITLSEMPQMYLDNPNGRIAYAMKTFAIKQLDILRREVAQEWKKGNKAKATRYAAGYAALFGLSGAVNKENKDFVLGKGWDIDDIPINTADALLSSMLASRYTSAKVLRGDVKGGVADLLTPPLGIYEAVIKDTNSLFNGDFAGRRPDLNIWDAESAKTLNPLGKIAYSWLGNEGNTKRREERQN